MESDNAPIDYYSSLDYIKKCLKRKENVDAESATQWGYDKALGPLNKMRFTLFADAQFDEKKKREQESMLAMCILTIIGLDQLIKSIRDNPRVPSEFASSHALHHSYSYEECSILPSYRLRFL